MAQTKEGARIAQETIKAKYGVTKDGKSKMHSRAGKAGGTAYHKVPVGFLAMSPEQRREAGRKGGLARVAKLKEQS